MRCFGWLVALLEIFSKKADDIVKNNDQVILPGLESETFEWLAHMITTTIRNSDRTKEIFFDYAELKYP